ncbi:unnamed protein product, partial [Amoebophrya sp. A25]|eukprot:GSA25T00000698001.1
MNIGPILAHLVSGSSTYRARRLHLLASIFSQILRLRQFLPSAPEGTAPLGANTRKITNSSCSGNCSASGCGNNGGAAHEDEVQHHQRENSFFAQASEATSKTMAATMSNPNYLHVRELVFALRQRVRIRCCSEPGEQCNPCEEGKKHEDHASYMSRDLSVAELVLRLTLQLLREKELESLQVDFLAVSNHIGAIVLHEHCRPQKMVPRCP